MSLLTACIEKLKALSPAEVQALSDKTGIAFPTLQKLKYGHTKNPRILTVEKIHAAMPGDEK